MNSYTLLVIDMQPGFEASGKKTVQKTIEHEIIKAKELNNPIVVLELVEMVKGKVNTDVFGTTHKFIRSLIRDYKKAFVLYKIECSGHKEVLSQKDKINTTCFRITGVNTDQCVEETVTELHENCKDSIFEIVKNGCNYGSPYYYEVMGESYNPYQGFPKSKRIKFI